MSPLYPRPLLLCAALSLLPGFLDAQDQGASSTQGLASELTDKFDPSKDTFETEVLNERAGNVLKEIAHGFELPHPIDGDRFRAFLDPGFRCDPLVRSEVEVVFEDDSFTVTRSSRPETPDAQRLQGAEGFAEGLGRLFGRWEGTNHVRSKLKLWRIEQIDAGFETEVLVQILAQAEGRAAQHSASWHCTWSLPAAGDPLPRLIDVRIEDVEEVVSRAGSTLFSDCTASVLGKTGPYPSQVLPGINHWTARLSNQIGMQMFGHHGLAVGDADGDGLEDLYVCDGGGLPNRLYLQQEDGTVVERARQLGLDWLDLSTSALWLDLDQDGDQDLVVSTLARLLICVNEGSTGFRLAGSFRAVTEPYSLAAADYDLDGDLDLFLCGYGAGAEGTEGPHRGLGDSAVSPVPYHDANNGGANALLRNDGDFEFVDVTDPVGLGQNNSRFSFAAAWEDFDDDGDPDLYVANDFGRNNLYENRGGKFVDIAEEAAVQDIASGMSVAWGDYDRDGRMDCYVSNMFSAAGNRVTYQRRFAESSSEDTIDKVQRMARGNTLFHNAGDGTFHDVSEEAGVTMGRWAWSSGFADLNNDGWQDLVVTNGYFTNEDSGDL